MIKISKNFHKPLISALNDIDKLSIMQQDQTFALECW